MILQGIKKRKIVDDEKERFFPGQKNWEQIDWKQIG